MVTTPPFLWPCSTLTWIVLTVARYLTRKIITVWHQSDNNTPCRKASLIYNLTCFFFYYNYFIFDNRNCWIGNFSKGWCHKQHSWWWRWNRCSTINNNKYNYRIGDCSQEKCCIQCARSVYFLGYQVRKRSCGQCRTGHR